MPAMTNVGPARTADEHLDAASCEAVLHRTCFGHLSFARENKVDVLPVRFAWLDGWAYFRADPEMRDVIARHPWLVLSVVELRDMTHFASVVVRGGCYATERTGSRASDDMALSGILELRDRDTVEPERASDVERSMTVFRLHGDEIRGISTYAPCPAGERPYNVLELQHLQDARRDQSASDDSRADDDGMAEPSPAMPTAPKRSDRSAKTRR